MPALTYNPDGTQHLHEYTRALTIGGKPDLLKYRCNHPDCSHWEFKSNLRGKRALCGVCRKNEVILTTAQLKLATPRCNMCSQSKVAQRIREKQSILEELFPQQETK